ncbi:nascent polypeptide-associated complex subunit alpha, muscle-specific form-like isoform X2 [Frankliniella occidentalis]|uniref:Nascent polypeptide-associated complex subunit alpha, muscle-specific form-like isoform X2 n=1 Tax=Frankliniella occidentalis TaxID=133901 RepID=A0A9C6WZU5_FRAOC|nr:nascent polypeptide-associated complex subunit alpha, muscle-specific form-like isoform X2 [Frankliniella occidentalis]
MEQEIQQERTAAAGGATRPRPLSLAARRAGGEEAPPRSARTPRTPRMGPAPIASFEDLLSQDLESPASPSSEQQPPGGDSAVGSGGGGEAKLLGFLEEGTEDLRSSTEELQFLEEPGTVEDQERRRRAQKRQRKESTQSCQADLAPSDSKERKDSTCSAEVAFLTSRLSSVGSAASGRSGRSAASSAAPSRSPSPGKLLLETSFCGVRPASQVVKVLGASASPGPSLGRGASPHSAVQSPGQGGDSERQRRRTMERQIALEGEAHAAAAPQEGLPLSAQGSPLTDREERERQARKIAAKRADEVRRAQGKEPKQRPYDRDEAAPLKSEQAKVREWEERKVKKMEEKELELKAEAEAEMRLELENKLKERRNKEKAEKKQRRAGRPRSKSKKDEDALVRIIPLHSSDEEYSEDDDQVGESDVQRRYQGVDAVEDLEVQRRHWLETHVSQDEDPNIVRIIPLRTASVEVAEKERERRESEGTTGPHRQTPRSTPSPKRPVAEPKLEKTTAVLEGERPSSRTSASSRSPQPPRSPQPSLSPQPPQLSLSPQPPRSPQPSLSPQPARSPHTQRSPQGRSPIPVRCPQVPTKSPQNGGEGTAGRRGPRRRVDPNALVRIIPLHSEDSYEGYGEDDTGPPVPPLDETLHDLGLPGGVRPAKRPEPKPSAMGAPRPAEAPPPRPAGDQGAAGPSRAPPGPRPPPIGSTSAPRAPGKVRQGRGRRVDPNALVRIIPLHSEDSYDGYSEDERPPPNLESPTDGPSISPPITLKTTKPLESRSERSEPPLSPLPPKSPQPPPSPQPPKSPLPPRSPQPATSTQPPRSPLPVVNEGAGPSGVSGAGGSEPAATQRVPGRPRGPRRKVDPNALVRIIPLHSEDSYEGYGEDDLPTDLPAPKGPKGSEGVDSIVDEIDMSKWREPSFEENDMVRIIPLKGDLPPPPKPASGGAPKPKPPALATTGRTKADSRPSRADAAASKKSPMMPPEEELVRIIPLHSDDEEREANRDRSPRAPSSLDRSPRSPLPSPGVVDTVPRSEPVRRRRRSDPKTQPQQGLTPGHTGDELVRIIPLHSDSDSETELAGYAAAARAARERPRKASDARSSASRTGSRAGSTSRASSRPGSARSERMEQLQIVPLTDPDTVEETGVCFTRRDLAIQQGRLTPSQLDWHSHGRNTPSDPQEQQGQRGPQVDDPLRSKPATPATLDLGDAQTGTSPRQRRREVDGQSSRSPSPPAAPPPASSVSAGRKASLSSILFRRAEVHSPDEMPAAPAKQRRASAAPAMVGLLKDVRGKSRDRHQQAPLPGESGKQRRESRDGGRAAAMAAAAAGLEQRDAARESGGGGGGGGGVFSTLFRKKSIPQERAEAPALPPPPAPGRDSAPQPPVLPIEGVEFTFTCEASYKECAPDALDGVDVTPLPSVSVNIPASSPPGASPCTPPGTPPSTPPGTPSGTPSGTPPGSILDAFGDSFVNGSPIRCASKDPVATAPSTELPPAPSAEPPPPAVPKKSASRDSWPAPPPPLDANANLSGSVEDDRHSRHSSGSEREVVPPPAPRPEGEEDAEEDHETKGLVLQQDSFDDELPYVPVTLPMERSVAVPLVPVKERLAAEVKTCPIDRPRSTTPINPSSLEEYVVPGGGPGAGASPASAGAGAGGREKLRISLPRTDSLTRRSRPQTRPWHDFASQALKPRSDSQSPPPPLPPRAPSTTPPSTWINFDEVPEKRKAPVRIQTIPSRGSIVTEPGTPGAGSRPAAAGTGTPSSGHQHHHHVHYVDPEDCRCECHETEHRHGQPAGSSAAPTAGPAPGLTPGAASGPAPTAGPPTGPRGAAPARPPKARPFGMDLDVSGSRSNRSSVASQNEHSSPEGPE